MAKNRKVKEILGLNKGGMSDYYKDLIWAISKNTQKI
jgi:hypothetical protein